MAELREGSGEALADTDWGGGGLAVSRSYASGTRFHKICFFDPAVGVNVSDICLRRSGGGGDWEAARVAGDDGPSLSPAPQAERRRETEESGPSLPARPKRGGMYWHQQAADPPQIIKSEV